MSKKNLLRILGMAVGTALCLCACSPEEYGPCSIPDTAAHRAACKADKNSDSKTATCAAEYMFDCDSLICGKFENSPAFCTYRCNPEPEHCNASHDLKDKEGNTYDKFDKESRWYAENCAWDSKKDSKDVCPEGAVCVEWVPGTGDYYCLPEDKGCSSNYTYGSESACAKKSDSGSKDSGSGDSGDGKSGESGE